MYPPIISFSKPYRQTHRCITIHTVAPDVLHIPAKFQPWSSPQSKPTLILSSFVDCPLPGLKCIPGHYYIGYNKHHPCHSSVYNIMLKIKKKRVYRVVGYYLHIHHPCWPTCFVALPLDASRQCHVTSTGLPKWKNMYRINFQTKICVKNGITSMYAACILTWYMYSPC